MLRVIGLCFVLSLLQACNFCFGEGCEKDGRFTVCRGESDEGLLTATSDELKNRGIDHSLEPGQLCYRRADQFDIDRAIAFVRSFRYGIYLRLKNKESEKRIVEWLTQENKEYQVGHTTEGERYIIVRSKNKEDEKQNREELLAINNGI